MCAEQSSLVGSLLRDAGSLLKACSVVGSPCYEIYFKDEWPKEFDHALGFPPIKGDLESRITKECMVAA